LDKADQLLLAEARDSHDAVQC